MNKTPTTLIIMDGFGLSPNTAGNAVRGARTPRLDEFFQDFAHTSLSASGLDVGLPDGQMGNSEVGHTNIGAGRVVFQDLPRITKSIQDGSFFENPAYLHAMDACLQQDTSLHLMGLLSDGGVHSHLDHLFALLELAKRKGLSKVYLHCFLDGRDVSPTSGADFLRRTQEACQEIGVGKIATVMGRYYAMDRDSRWDRVELAYDAIVYGEGTSADVEVIRVDPVAAVERSYQMGVTDAGVYDAAVKAVETVDQCVGRVVDATLDMGGIAMITADHGNAEQMTEADGSPMTAHTTNPVPFILCGAGTELRSGGRLADIAPTILDVMGLACPEEMDGKTLIVK